MFLRAVLLGVCWLIFGADSTPVEKPPGIVIRVKSSALKIANDYGTKYLVEGYIRMGLLGMNQTESCIFGSCSLQNFTASDYIPSMSNVTFAPGNSIEWKLEEAELNLGFDFEIQSNDVSEGTCVKGKASVHLSGLSLAAEFTLGRGIDGQLLISLTKCSVDLRVLDKNVTVTHKVGDSSKFDDFFTREIHDYLQDRVNKSVSTVMCNIAGLVARVIPDHLSQMKKETVAEGMNFDDSLVRNITMENECIEAAFSGGFRMVGEVGEPIPPSNIYLPPEESSMVTAYVSESVINTWCDVLYKTDWFSVNFTNDMFPWKFRNYNNLFDNTCEDKFCFGTIFPNIAEKYPNTSVIFVFRASSRPSVTISQGLLTLQGEFDLSIVIPGKHGSNVTVAELSMSVFMFARLLMFNDRVVRAVYYPKITTTDNGSPKEFASYLPRFQFFLQMIMDWILAPHINYFGAIGNPLYFPDGIGLANADLGFETGALRFSSDIIIDPKIFDASKMMLLLFGPSPIP